MFSSRRNSSQDHRKPVIARPHADVFLLLFLCLYVAGLIMWALSGNQFSLARSHPVSLVGLDEPAQENSTTTTTPIPLVRSPVRLTISKGLPLYLRNDDVIYFGKMKDQMCLYEGYDLMESYKASSDRGYGCCACTKDWFGTHCSLPQLLANQTQFLSQNTTILATPTRRLISVVFIRKGVNWLDWLENHLARMGSLVEALLIVWPRDEISPQWYQLSQSPSFNMASSKIRHVFPYQGEEERYIDNSLNFITLIKSLTMDIINKIHSYRSDDLLLISSSNWMPPSALYMTLKLHRGYPDAFVMLNGTLVAMEKNTFKLSEDFWIGMTFSALQRLANPDVGALML